MKNENKIETEARVLTIVKTHSGYALDYDEQWFLSHAEMLSRMLSEAFNHLQTANQKQTVAPAPPQMRRRIP